MSAGCATIDRYLLHAGAQQQTRRNRVTRANDGTDGQTDGQADEQTDTWPSHKPCSAYYASNAIYSTQPFNGVFSRTTWVSRYQKGKTSLDLNQAIDDGVLGMQQHQLDHMQTVCTSLQTDSHTNTSSLNFYRQDALPDAQPTVSKH